jgi:hypothetical protein
VARVIGSAGWDWGSLSLADLEACGLGFWIGGDGVCWPLLLEDGEELATSNWPVARADHNDHITQQKILEMFLPSGEGAEKVLISKHLRYWLKLCQQEMETSCPF